MDVTVIVVVIIQPNVGLLSPFLCKIKRVCGTNSQKKENKSVYHLGLKQNLTCTSKEDKEEE